MRPHILSFIVMVVVVLIDYFLLDTMPNTFTAFLVGSLVLILSIVTSLPMIRLLMIIAVAETGPLNTIREELMQDDLFADCLEDLLFCIVAWIGYTIISNFALGAGAVALWASYSIHPLANRLGIVFITTYGDKLRKVT